jgi:D-alanyl-D-alanine carboxypeptidase/D-alanyl-D-alanine-endopeptidase (penicillin-binding protein 4)
MNKFKFLLDSIEENIFNTSHFAWIDVNLLEKMLPVVGEDGTVKNLLNNSPAKGKMWLKSGSMRRILCYSGIAKGKSGRLVALTIYLNGSISAENKKNKKEVEKILETIYNHT